MRHVRRWLAGSAALLAGLSTHGLAALIVFAILVVIVVVILAVLVRWIIDNGDRSDRVTRMISAWHGGTGRGYRVLRGRRRRGGKIQALALPAPPPASTVPRNPA